MPLSEHEQRLLDQIERALYAEDPKFASTVRSSDLKSHLLRRVRRASVLLVLGLVTLVVGVAVKLPPVGVAGFVVMLVAALVIGRSVTRMSGRGGTAAVSSPRRSRRSAGSRGGLRAVDPTPREPGERGGMLGRVEERWRRRWDERE